MLQIDLGSTENLALLYIVYTAYECVNKEDLNSQNMEMDRF
jgi:hypothetical protein